jgi:hypothetical protein
MRIRGNADQPSIVLKLYWLARGNVQVGVFYDVSLGPQADTFLAQAKANLATLPNG